jgi:prepilin-type N-terminal cleavage/methylation domain-containing protein
VRRARGQHQHLDQAAARPSRAGFSLVEVLVVLLIVGGLMLAITQLLEGTRISRDTIHNIQETQLAGPAIMDLVERDLRSLLAYDRRAEDLLAVQDRVVYGMDADALDFSATTNSLLPVQVEQRLVRSDVCEVGYRVRPNPADDDFLEIYRREDFGIDDEPFDGGTYTFLHDRVKRFNVQLFTEDGIDAEPLDEWHHEEGEAPLPRRLEISMTLELAPRINREQLRYAPVEMRTVTYFRVIRLSEALFRALEVSPVPLIPELRPPDEEPAETPPPPPP